MSIATEKIAETFLNIVVNVPIDCDWPLYSQTELEVIYGNASLTAVYNTDYTVQLDDPDFNTFTVTPLAPLLTKINNLIAADDTEVNYITIRRKLNYLTSITTAVAGSVTFLSREVERVHMKLQQLAEGFERCLKLPRKEVGTEEAESEVPSIAERAGKVFGFDDDGNVAAKEDFSALLTDAETARDEAQDFRDETQTLRDDAENFKNQAISAAAEGLFNGNLDLTFANSPYVPLAANEGYLYWIDTTGGNVVVNLSALSVYAEDMKFAFMKVDNSGNSITINRGGTNTIEGGTSVVITDQFVVVTLVGNLSAGKWAKVVQNSAIADGAVTNAKLATNAVSTTKVQDAAITNAKLANMANKTIKARKTAGSGVPEDCTIHELLDFIGSMADGDIIYRSGGLWTRLAKGTSLQTLRMNSGATAPEWATAAGATRSTRTNFSGATMDISVPAGTKRVVIQIKDWNDAGSQAYPALRFSTGATFKTTGYNGFYEFSLGTTGYATNGYTNQPYAIMPQENTGASFTGFIILDIAADFRITWYALMHNQATSTTSQGGTYKIAYGDVTMAGDLDAIRFSYDNFSGNNMNAGNVVATFYP